jgi:TRAP-type uncharacterized transport system substrate-binding protein
MAGLGGLVWRGLAAVACVIALVWLALWYFIPAPPTAITIVAGLKGGAFEHIANRYRDILARHHVKLNLRFAANPDAVVELITNRTSGVDGGFLFTGQANASEFPHLISLGRINYAPWWIFYRNTEPLDRLAQLRGKRLNITPLGDLVNQILTAHGITRDNTTISMMFGAPAVAKALRDDDFDAVFMPPIDMNSPVIQSLLRDSSVRLMSLAQADALTRLFPSFHRVVLPQGVISLEKNIPASDVNLIASTDAVVVRKDLHPEIIYLLAQAMKEVHGEAGIFQSAGEFPTINDPEFPVAEEAAEYYKNGPSLLQRYLSFWMINYAKRIAAILVTAIAIVIPLFTFTPKLYAWLLNLRLARLYRRLRLVNARLKGELAADQIGALQGDLDSIDHAANILPMRQSDLFFSLLMHIEMTRTRLAARLAELRSERRVA